MTTFTGKAEVDSFVLVAIKGAIKFYLKTGFTVNRSYTPTNMLRKAGEITGKKYKRGQLQIALDDLQQMFDEIVSGGQKS
jgi:hypothetical protein